MFMVMDGEKLDELCELFPSSSEILKQRAIIRRNRYMSQKLLNSKTYRRKLEKMTESEREAAMDRLPEDDISFMSDENPEDEEEVENDET